MQNAWNPGSQTQPAPVLSILVRKFAGCHVRWNPRALRKNWALQVADNVYVENICKKNPFTHYGNGAGVRCLTDVKSVGFQS